MLYGPPAPGAHTVAGGGHPATAPPEEEVRAAPHVAVSEEGRLGDPLHKRHPDSKGNGKMPIWLGFYKCGILTASGVEATRKQSLGRCLLGPADPGQCLGDDLVTRPDPRPEA